jgi:UDP-N-acetylglucosamine--N-acetylmuramyl-(pentapeptide) pyrophosphoryl-undecaprenol N-acetylglucosamine transferase
MNAKALAIRNAAIMVRDNEAPANLTTTALDIITDNDRLNTLSRNIKEMALPNAAIDIAKKVMELVGSTAKKGV